MLSLYDFLQETLSASFQLPRVCDTSLGECLDVITATAQNEMWFFRYQISVRHGECWMRKILTLPGLLELAPSRRQVRRQFDFLCLNFFAYLNSRVSICDFGTSFILCFVRGLEFGDLTSLIIIIFTELAIT